MKNTKKGQQAAGDASVTRRMKVVPLADVKMRATRWLWAGRLPLGKVVILDGAPGQGKSCLTLDIAARGSRGSAMPDSAVTSPAAWDTIVVTYEDDPAETLRPRLEAAGADLNRVHHVEGVGPTGSADLLPPSLPNDLDALESELRDKPSVRLVIIDPLSAALSADVDSHRDTDVRRVMSKLARLAQEYSVCILIVRHLRKGGGAAINAGAGSIGIIGAARVGLLVASDPDDEECAVLAVSKSNLAPTTPALRFKKVTASFQSESGPIETMRLEWLGEATLTADELLALREEAPHESRDAGDWLRQLLSGGKVERKELMNAAETAGFAERTIDYAAKRTGVLKKREGFGPAMRSYWELPSSAASQPVAQVPQRTADCATGGTDSPRASETE